MVTFVGEVAFVPNKDALANQSILRTSLLPNILVVQCAMLSALAIVLGHALAVVPNVEMVTLIIFVAGYHAGARGGLITALTTALYFNYLNPMGQVFLPVLVGQFIGWGFTSLVGAWFGAKRLNSKLTFALAGALLTLIYQVIVNVAYVKMCMPSCGFNEQVATILAGLSFTAVHIASNTAVFALMTEPLLKIIQRSR